MIASPSILLGSLNFFQTINQTFCLYHKQYQINDKHIFSSPSKKLIFIKAKNIRFVILIAFTNFPSHIQLVIFRFCRGQALDAPME